MGNINESPLCSPSGSLWGMKADQSGFRRECFNIQGITTKQKQKKNRKRSVGKCTHEILIMSWMSGKKTENNWHY